MWLGVDYYPEQWDPALMEAAIVYDYDSLVSFRVQRQSVLLDCQGEMKKLYKAFFDMNVPVDVIPADAGAGAGFSGTCWRSGTRRSSTGTAKASGSACASTTTAVRRRFWAA